MDRACTQTANRSHFVFAFNVSCSPLSHRGGDFAVNSRNAMKKRHGSKGHHTPRRHFFIPVRRYAEQTVIRMNLCGAPRITFSITRRRSPRQSAAEQRDAWSRLNYWY